MAPKPPKWAVSALLLAAIVGAAVWVYPDAEAASSSEAAPAALTPLASAPDGAEINAVNDFDLVVDTESVQYRNPFGGGAWRGKGASGAVVTCANPPDDFAVLCTAFNKLVEVYVDGPVDVAGLASDAAAGVRAAALAARTTDPPPCVLPSAEFREMCAEIDKAADTRAAAWAAAVAMLEGVGDRYVRIMEPDIWAALLERGDPDGIRIGLGLSYGLLEGNEPCSEPSATCRPVIYEVLADSPADQAGLEVGDVLVSVKGRNSFTCNDVDLLDLAFSDGESAEVVVERSGTRHTHTLVAAEVVDPFAFDLVVDGNVGYLQLDRFAEQSSRSFVRSLRRLLDAEVEFLVVDLRNNPGGSGWETVRIAKNFLKNGDLVTRWVFANQQIIDRRAYSDGIASDEAALPMAVTVNSMSASASEMFTLATAGNDRALIVGTRTYGKHTGWSGYTVYTSDGETMLGGIVIKSAYFYGPGGASSEGGIAPDVSRDLPMCLHPVGVARAALDASSPRITEPVAPFGVSALSSDVSVTVSWVVPAQPGVYLDEMFLERVVDDGDGDGDVVVWSGLVIDDWDLSAESLWSKTVGGLEAGVEYRFRVRLATTGHGDVFSETVAVSVQSEPPVAPEGLAASVGDDGQVSLSWTIPAQPGWVEVGRVMVERRDSGGEAHFGAVADVGWERGTTSYSATDESPRRGLPYAYRVRMLAGGRFIASDTLWVTVPAQVESTAGPLAGFSLIDASDQSLVQALADGGRVLLRNAADGDFTVRADIADGRRVGSVYFELTGPVSTSRTESWLPYALYGDAGTDSLYGGGPLPEGEYTLTATAYSLSYRRGDTLGTLEATFDVVAQADP